MNTTDIDVLLKEIFSKEFSPSLDLEQQTWQKMNKIPQKNKWFFLTLLSVFSFPLLALETIIILSVIQHIVLKIVFLQLYISAICFFVFYTMISINTNTKIKQIL